LRGPLTSTPGIAAVIAEIRVEVPGAGPDRFLAPEIAAVTELVSSGALLGAVESTIGALA
jgi:histidine ammonia-lyase